jgi:hypothetical protein
MGPVMPPIADFTFMSLTSEMVPAESAGDAGEGLLADATLVVEGAEPVAEIDSQEAGESRKRNRIDRQRAADEMVAWFAACARCSFFLAGYRIAFGLDELQTAAFDSKSGWLSLSWNNAMCKLVRKSYGNRMDLDCFHFEGCCPECHRQFTYRADENGDLSAGFRIELRPRSGRS